MPPSIFSVCGSTRSVVERGKRCPKGGSWTHDCRVDGDLPPGRVERRALLAFHQRLIYQSFVDTAPALGIDPLSDQQSGFAIMMASGIVYVGTIVTTAAKALAVTGRDAWT